MAVTDPHLPFNQKAHPFSPTNTLHLHFSLINYQQKNPLSMNNRRRPRARKSTLSKPRKPKFLSLSRQFPPNDDGAAAAAASSDPRQLDLFPLHPESDGEIQDQADDVALFFSAADSCATSLTGLLDNSSTVDSNSSHTDNDSSRVEYWAAVVQRALRSREGDRDWSEEKWVRYSEVVKEEEVSSSGVEGVSLKLDYQHIINAWSDKGSLFVDAHIVPDPFLSHHIQGANEGVWRVPEMRGQRKASVLRYKEKRQNRLFSKKIRYQVRKLNAEKRPRLKGRFVKKA